MRNPSADFWRGKRVFVTGHTGFKGAWLVLWLHQLGAHVSALSLKPATNPNLSDLLKIDQLCTSQFGDISDLGVVKSAMQDAQADMVLHLAAQALVKPAYTDPVATFQANVIGTAHVLEAIRHTPSVKVAVMITTDKVYDNKEWVWPYRETDRLGGHDPYSASKAACELVIDSYKRSFLNEAGVAVSSARAGNVVGGGDWSVHRLIPDAIKAWVKKERLEIRSPHAVRPWQHVLEPLNGYLCLAESTWDKPELAGAYNFGPDASEAASVKTVIEEAQMHWSGAPVQFAQTLAMQHEAQLLTLDTSKAKSELSITPRLSLRQTIAMTINWYQAFEAGANASQLCQENISNYVGVA
jgi:CDP-glucose 4,6-dehydratase